jgi:uncharacterized protein
MPKRENKATIREAGLEDAFRQGFEEGMRMAAGAQVIYEFIATFEGTDLRQVQFSDLDQCLAEAREMLLHGHGTEVRIRAVAVPTPQRAEQMAVEPGATGEEEIAEAEVIQDDPSRAD